MTSSPTTGSMRALWSSVASGLLASSLLVAGAPVASAVGAPTGDVVGPVRVSAAVHHDLSLPLRSMVPSAPSAATLRERPLRLIGGSGPSQGDGALQSSVTGPAVATTSLLSFAGLGVCGASAGCWAPPDTNGAVGASQYVQWVNTALAVFDKATGAMVPGFPKAGNATWLGFGGGCETNNDGDPVVQYDKAAGRWILTQFSVSGANGTSIPYLQCVAVSQSSDATGAYFRYAFPYAQFPDYPKLGVWPDAYYMTFNMFTNTFVGAQACAYDRAAMLSGTAATQECFQLSASYGGLLPSDLDGTGQPPAGSPAFLMNFGSNSLNLWKFHVDFANPGNASFSGPTNIPVAAFKPACGGGTCIAQPQTGQRLDSLGDRLMYRLAYRRFTDGRESLVVNHSVTVGKSRLSTTTGIRWYEIRDPNGTPTVFQQGTYAPDSTSRWMGSIAMDKVGDIAVGYSASSGSVYPSVRYTGRLPTDPLGTLEGENVVRAGGGSQLQNLSRWGDYSAMTVDPVDDCTFWYTNEYLKSSGTFNWSTWITSFRFPGCS